VDLREGSQPDPGLLNPPFIIGNEATRLYNPNPCVDFIHHYGLACEFFAEGDLPAAFRLFL
jgi:hypothetical protein